MNDKERNALAQEIADKAGHRNFLKWHADILNSAHCQVQELQNGTPLVKEEWDQLYVWLEEAREYFLVASKEETEKIQILNQYGNR